MEAKVLSEQMQWETKHTLVRVLSGMCQRVRLVEWEAQRVAAAFGLESFAKSPEQPFSGKTQYVALMGSIEVWWNILIETQAVAMVTVGGDDDFGCQVACSASGWKFAQDQEYDPDYRQIMAKGLFRLGIEDERVLAELNHPLSAHEKLELRLSMPREFWPKKWLGEDTK